MVRVTFDAQVVTGHPIVMVSPTVAVEMFLSKIGSIRMGSEGGDGG